MNAPSRVLLVFLDGVGLGVRDPRRNPFFLAPPPFLTALLERFPSVRDANRNRDGLVCQPLRATMGVPGLPQSGTGQTALYGGVNAARLIGHHFGPYLYSSLKPVLSQRNIFSMVRSLPGIDAEEVVLANAFPQRFFDYMQGPRRRIVAGIFAAHEAGVRFRNVDDLTRGTGISTDLTGQRWKDIGHPEVDAMSAEDAGARLAHIAGEARFTLFEYFATDKAGHERDPEQAVDVITELDAFMAGLVEARPRDLLVLITSDHGNLEDLSTKSHTRNPVPLLQIGPRHGHDTSRLHGIEDLAAYITGILTRP